MALPLRVRSPFNRQWRPLAERSNAELRVIGVPGVAVMGKKDRPIPDATEILKREFLEDAHLRTAGHRPDVDHFVEIDDTKVWPIPTPEQQVAEDARIAALPQPTPAERLAELEKQNHLDWSPEWYARRDAQREAEHAEWLATPEQVEWRARDDARRRREEREEREKNPPTPKIGGITGDDLPSGATPDQLADPFLTPEGVTVIYGKGGAGKGYVSLYLTLQLIRAGHRVAVVDFETHPNEWGLRMKAMGFTQAEKQIVSYYAPNGDSWAAKRGALTDLTEILKADLDKRQSDYLVIDSYTTATTTGDSMGGAAAAQEFFTAVGKLGRPALVIAHVKGGGERFPDKPFGSVFCHNLARETWAVAQMGDGDEEPDESGVMTIELRNMKSNGRAKSAPQFLTFTFDPMGQVRVDGHKPIEAATTAGLIQDILKRSLKPLTAKELTAAIKADTGITVTLHSLNQAPTEAPGPIHSD